MDVRRSSTTGFWFDGAAQELGGIPVEAAVAAGVSLLFLRRQARRRRAGTMQWILKSESTAAQRRVFFEAITASDAETRLTGLAGTLACRISKNGAATAVGGGTFTEIDSTNLPGCYYYEAAAGDVSAAGLLSLRFSVALMETVERTVMITNVSAYNAIDAAVWNVQLPGAFDPTSAGYYLPNISGRIPAALVSSKMDSVVSGAVGSVTGAVGSVTGAVGSVTGSVGSIAAGGIAATSFAANAITAAKVAADVNTAIAAAVWAAISEGAETFGDAIRLVGARLFGKATVQDGDGAYTFRDKADTKNRIVLTKTGTARTASTRDGT